MFTFGDKVELEGTNTEGTVVGRVEYLDGETQYFVRYVNWQGELTKGWYNVSDLVLLDEEDKSEDEYESDDSDDDSDDSDDNSDDDSGEDEGSRKPSYYWE